MVTMAVTAAIGCLFLSTASADGPMPLQVCILSGCPTYKSEESLPPFQEWLEQNYAVECTRVVRQADDDLPGVDQLERCDVALIFFKRMHLRGEQLEAFKAYVTSGKPIVAVRTASHAVQTWLQFDPEVLGGNYHGHYDNGPITTISVADAAAGHPVLEGVTINSAHDALYKNQGHADDIHVLLTGTIPGQPPEAIAWTRELNGGRIFYTSLGAQETFQQPDFRRMLANALFWTAGREKAMRAGAN
jgi:type 1 glutamine amidotransferase